jgi:hypothetical protein
VKRLNTCSTQATPISLFVQLEGDELIRTECSPALTSSTQLAWRPPEVLWYMRLGGKADPLAHIQARRVTYSRELFWRPAVTSFFSYILLLNTLFDLLVTLVRNSFSSILYILQALILYSSIFWCRRLKYRLYLAPELAWWRLRSIPVCQCDVRWEAFLVMKRVT